MMTKKGISPLIATVLIIGFTIVLAAVVMQWGTGFVKKLIGEQDIATQAQTKCVTMDLSMEVSPRTCTTATVAADCGVATDTCTADGKCTTAKKVRITNNANLPVKQVLVQKIDVNGNSITVIVPAGANIDVAAYGSFSVNVPTDAVEIQAIPFVESEKDTVNGFGCSIDSGAKVKII